MMSIWHPSCLLKKTKKKTKSGLFTCQSLLSQSDEQMYIGSNNNKKKKKN